MVVVSWHGIFYKMSLGDGIILEEKIRSHTLQMQLLPNQVLSMADEREERVGKENIGEVQIR